jgi:hypothetical protein
MELSRRRVRIAGAALGLLLVVGGAGVYSVQNRVAAVSDLLPVGYAVGAGMVAAVNPCGVLLLPSAVAYYLTRGRRPSYRRRAASRAPSSSPGWRRSASWRSSPASGS